ncbi:MAG: hypothetical protein ACYDHE_15080 [Candidatus Acidiferrales bacterium]
MKNKSTERRTKVVDLATLAFYAGANGVECDEGLAQIEADHAQDAKQLEAERSAEIGLLEATQATLLHLQPQAEEQWVQLRELHKDDAPRVFVPLIIGIVGVAIAAAEASILAPTFDMLSVKDPTFQFVAALALTLGCATWMHLALEASRKPIPLGRLLRYSAGLPLLALVVLGIWRAQALAFAAIHGRSALAPFLAQSSSLTSLVTSLLTIVFPVASAFAIHCAFHHAEQWWEFREARKVAQRLKTELDLVTKQTESAKKKLAADVEVIWHESEEWQAQYKHYWQLGDENGAKKGPVWPVWVKSTAVALGVLSVGLILSLLGLTGAVVGGGVGGIATGLAAAAHFYHRWEHPTPEQFLRNANTRFKDNGARQEVRLSTITLDEPERRSSLSESQRRELVQSANGGV